MNKRKISALILSFAVSLSLFKGSELVFAKEINEGIKKEEEKNKSNCIAGDYHEVHNKRNYEDTPTINGIKLEKSLIDINYSKGVIIEPKYIVIHDTDNRDVGADAMANRNYFANHPQAEASAHYIIDEGNIVQALEDNWRGWHVGDGNNKYINNSTTIGIELCVNEGNDFNKTLENGIELTKYLMKKHNIPSENVVMHRDASGKTCSRMMIEDRAELWPYFKEEISKDEDLEGNIATKMQGEVVNVSSLKVKESPSEFGRVLYEFKEGEILDIYEELDDFYKVAYVDANNKKLGYVSKEHVKLIEDSNESKPEEKPETSLNKEGVVKVKSALNLRKGPGSDYEVIGTLQNEERVEVIKEVDGWYEVEAKGKRGYASKDYIKV